MTTVEIQNYQNGNCHVVLYADGTRAIEWPDGQSKSPEYPFNFDCKITNKCDNPHCMAFCVVPDTIIYTLNGEKPIKSLVVGERILSYNTSKNLIEHDEVEEVISHEVDEEILEIETENGLFLQLTKNHKVWTERGWVEAQYLTEQDIILIHK